MGLREKSGMTRYRLLGSESLPYKKSMYFPFSGILHFREHTSAVIPHGRPRVVFHVAEFAGVSAF